MDLKLGAGKIVKIVFKVLGAIFTGKISLKAIGHFIRQGLRASKIKKHYKKYPENPNDLGDWVKNSNEIWKNRIVKPRVFETITVKYP